MTMQTTRVVIVSDGSRPPYYQEILCGRHSLIADKPLDHGGLDAGPSPFALLLSSLGACTAIALRMHCERRSWPIARLMVTLQLPGSARCTQVVQLIHILGSLTDAQRLRLVAVCERTPVTQLLKGRITIGTQILVQRLV